MFASHPGPPRSKLVPGVLCCFLCEAMSVSPADTHLSLLTCHLIWLISWEWTKESPLPCLSCCQSWGWLSALWGSLALIWDSAEVSHLLDPGFFPCAPSSEERSFGSRTKHISVRGETEQHSHWELHHAMLTPKELSLLKFWSSFHYLSVITFYFENFEGWGEEFVFWYLGTSK